MRYGTTKCTVGFPSNTICNSPFPPEIRCQFPAQSFVCEDTVSWLSPKGERKLVRGTTRRFLKFGFEKQYWFPYEQSFRNTAIDQFVKMSWNVSVRWRLANTSL